MIPRGGGVLEISSDGNDRRIFGFEIFNPGIFFGYENLACNFLGSLI